MYTSTFSDSEGTYDDDEMLEESVVISIDDADEYIALFHQVKRGLTCLMKMLKQYFHRSRYCLFLFLPLYFLVNNKRIHSSTPCRILILVRLTNKLLIYATSVEIDIIVLFGYTIDHVINVDTV